MDVNGCEKMPSSNAMYRKDPGNENNEANNNVICVFGKEKYIDGQAVILDWIIVGDLQANYKNVTEKVVVVVLEWYKIEIRAGLRSRTELRVQGLQNIESEVETGSNNRV